MSAVSVTDLSVADRNVGLYELLWRLPTGLVLDFLERASEWELRNALAERLAATTEMVREPMAATPSLRGDADRVARECAEYLLSSNATLGALMSQLEHGADAPLTVRWSGVEHLREAREGGRPVLVFAPHVGFLYAVPIALAALGERSSVLGGETARDVLIRVFSTVAPRLMDQVGYIVVPGEGCARAALDTLARGELLVMFPEVNRGATGNVRSATTTFLGRTIWLPTTAARLARMAGAVILPATVLPDGPRGVVVEFAAPVAAPADRHGDLPTSVWLFRWLEGVVEDRPHLWLGWTMLDTDMRVTPPVSASGAASGAART